jgi:signal transduction histidine kinase
MRLDYALDIPGDLRLAIAGEDLNEILGPLLENAVRFARRQIRVAGAGRKDGVVLTVEDDGPGINASDVSQAMQRGARLDEAGGGHGLGLAIARQLVEATGGTIALGSSPLGGLRVELHWANGQSVRNSGAERLPPSDQTA